MGEQGMQGWPCEESVQLSNGVQATFACVVACSCHVLFAILMEKKLHACIYMHRHYYMHTTTPKKHRDPENNQILVETNFPTPIWQGLS